jgi:hypothetical protein
VGTLLNGGTGRAGDEPPAEDVAPLLRWALREQVSGQEPSDTVWQGVKAQITAPHYHIHAARRLATTVSALVVAVVALTVGMSYDRGGEQLQVSVPTVQPAAIVEATVAIAPAPPLVAALPVESVTSPVRAEVREQAPVQAAVVQPRVTKPVDTQDDAMKPLHIIRLAVVKPVVVQPGAIVFVLTLGSSPRPI